MDILLVDDNKENRIHGKKELTDMGHKVVVCSTYKNFTELLKIKAFDVVITDLLMPADPWGQSDITEYTKDLAYGYPFVLGLILGVFDVKVKPSKIILISDGNHHSHPMQWMQDTFSNFRGEVNGIVLHSYGEDCPVKYKDEVRVKDYRRVLETI